ncbi:MAG: hypothetical protein SCH98_19475, partial [Deferrisomatales bacterium]|nr:hypothetical protein [Deferrisomatales bacterium]
MPHRNLHTAIWWPTRELLIPDCIVLVDDGRGPDDLLRLVIEVKGYRREDAKDKKLTMETYWVPGVNHLKTHGRWAFAEFTEVFQMEADFKAKVESEFNKLIGETVKGDDSAGQWNRTVPKDRPQGEPQEGASEG